MKQSNRQYFLLACQFCVWRKCWTYLIFQSYLKLILQIPFGLPIHFNFLGLLHLWQSSRFNFHFLKLQFKLTSQMINLFFLKCNPFHKKINNLNLKMWQLHCQVIFWPGHGSQSHCTDQIIFPSTFLANWLCDIAPHCIIISPKKLDLKTWLFFNTPIFYKKVQVNLSLALNRC